MSFEPKPPLPRKEALRIADALPASGVGAAPSLLQSGRARYWTDANYSRFYDVSSEERRCIKTAAAGAGLSRGGVLRMEAAWKVSGVGEPPRSLSTRGRLREGGEPTDGRLAMFQAAFAALSQGGAAIGASQVRPLLLSMQVVLDAGASGRLQEALIGAGDLVSYREALAIYQELAPGPAGPREAKAAVESAINDLVMDQEDADVGPQLSARRVRPAGGWSRPVTPLDLEEHCSSRAAAAVVAGVLRDLDAEDVEDGVSAERVRPGGGGWSPEPAVPPEPSPAAHSLAAIGRPRRALPPLLRGDRLARTAVSVTGSPRSPLQQAGYSLSRFR